MFAPTNAAFQALAGTLQSIVADSALLTSILKYHVVAGTHYSADLKDGQKLTTVEGKDLTVHTRGGVFVDHAYVTKPDIPVLNGVIHVIDAVLVPN